MADRARGGGEGGATTVRGRAGRARAGGVADGRAADKGGSLAGGAGSGGREVSDAVALAQAIGEVDGLFKASQWVISRGKKPMSLTVLVGGVAGDGDAAGKAGDPGAALADALDVGDAVAGAGRQAGNASGLDREGGGECHGGENG